MSKLDKEKKTIVKNTTNINKKKWLFIFSILLCVIAYFLLSSGGKEKYSKQKAMDDVVKKLPINSSIRFVGQKSAEPSRSLNNMLVLEQDKFTIIMLELSAQTKFGATRSTDGRTYKVTLYNTIRGQNFKSDISSQAASNLIVKTVDEDDLLLTFDLLPKTSVTEIAFTDENSTKLAIKLFSKDETDDESKKKSLEVKKLKNQKTPSELSKEYYQKALDFANEGNITKAYLNAKRAISFRQDNHLARKMFILSALELGRRQDAEIALEKGIYLAPNMLIYKKIKAKLLLGNNQPQAALETLLSQLPDITVDGDYYAFIAAVRQKLGDHKKAIKLYASLLKLYPHEGEWWAGLGVSYDSIGSERQALTAFNKALDVGGLDIELQNYVESRIYELD
ncbi:MAG: hypothetical protein HRT87_02220 [Legionellales bacterium]|nr:hypothetical protein [Legionellales bacterium]